MKSIAAFVFLPMSAILLLSLSSIVLAESRTADGIGTSEIDACADAKHNVERKCESGKVATFHACSCEEKQTPPNYTWVCEVEATCEIGSDSDDDEEAGDEG